MLTIMLCITMFVFSMLPLIIHLILRICWTVCQSVMFILFPMHLWMTPFLNISWKIKSLTLLEAVLMHLSFISFKYAASLIIEVLHVMYLCYTQNSNVSQFNELRRNILQVSHVPCVLVSLSLIHSSICMYILCVLCVLWVLLTNLLGGLRVKGLHETIGANETSGAIVFLSISVPPRKAHQWRVDERGLP